MKTALISFHKNIGRYPKEWIDIYKSSVLNQTYKDFKIYEINYGGGTERIYDNSIFLSLNLKDHAEAHNYLLSLCFSEGYDYVFNTNVDDYYPPYRLKLQVDNYNSDLILISGNYQSFNSDGNIGKSTQFHSMNIDQEFEKNHNIIAHPACAYTRKYIDYGDKLISEQIPSDDFQLWKRLRSAGANFKIVPEVLMYYRISDLKTKL